MKGNPIQGVEQIRCKLALEVGQGKILGLVPTMGALHDGHGRLIEQAKNECDTVVVSLFINPLQFGPSEDIKKYPKDLGSDLLFCEMRGVDVVFAPSVDEIYPGPQHTFVEVGSEGEGLCGLHRPGHFRGVATVVLKLLNIVKPNRAYFGEKDFQQLMVVRRMVADFALPVEIIGVETERESGGLAISSRNQYLNSSEREAADVLYQALSLVRVLVASGEDDPVVVKEAAMKLFNLEPRVRVEYLEVIDPLQMLPVGQIANAVRAMGGVWVGKTRLIDNLLCEPPKLDNLEKESTAEIREVPS